MVIVILTNMHLWRCIMSKSYDSVSGILEAIKTLQGLNDLAKERRVAGYDRDERLHIFYVYIQPYLWLLDSCGNMMRAPDINLIGIPQVFLQDDDCYLSMLRQFDEQRLSASFGSNRRLAPSDNEVYCPECKKQWTIRNCGDVVVNRETVNFDCDEYIGRTINFVKESIQWQSGKVYTTQPDHLIQNDRFIDLSPAYPDSKDDWEKSSSLVKNRSGWVGERDGINDEYVLQSGDKLYVNQWIFLHELCDKQRIVRETTETFRALLDRSGFEGVAMVTIPNEYWKYPDSPPWFLFQSHGIPGTIKIGWRKRVINIDWSDTNLALQYLFEGEHTTIENSYVHAHGYEKASEYLLRIASYIESM